MAINTDILNSVLIAQTEEALAAVFSDEELDCTPGTALRELVIRPAAVMRAHLDVHQQAIVESLNLAQIARGEVPGDDTLVDALASTYRVFRRSQTPSRGTIVFRLSSNAVTYIGPAYRFYVGDYPLTLFPTYVGVPDIANVQSTAEVQYVPIQAMGTEYYMTIPVTCPSGKDFAVGTAVQFTGPIMNILSVSVYSSIGGGSQLETNKSLAGRVLYGVVPGVLSTPLQIQNGFGTDFAINPHRVVVFGTGSAAQRRDADNTGGFVDVAVAPSGGVEITQLPFTALQEGEKFTATIDASGVYEIVSLSVDASPVSNFEVTWGASASSLHTLSAATARYSSLQTATISFLVDGLESTVNGTATVRRVSNLRAMQTWLDSSERRAPGQDTLIRAPVPCFLSVQITISGGTDSTESLRTRIVEHLNDLPLGRGFVSAQDITDALVGTQVSLSYPVIFSGRVVLPDNDRVFSSTNGTLAFPSLPDELDPLEVAFFVDYESVGVSRK